MRVGNFRGEGSFVKLFGSNFVFHLVSQLMFTFYKFNRWSLCFSAREVGYATLNLFYFCIVNICCLVTD